MFFLKKFFIDGFISVLFLFVFIVSCSPTSSSSSSSGVPPSVREAEVQLRSTLGEGITSSGSGSQSDPFKILIDESVSLERPSLALSELFSNVASVAEGQSKVGTARLDITGLTVEPGLGSKLSIELKASNNEKKYATLYFQDSARLTNAVQSGEAVLDSMARGGVAKAVEVVVTVYKEESEDESWNVALDSLFDYNEQKFDVTVFKEGEETQNARFVHEGKTEITDFANYTVTEEVVVELVFEPKEGVDPLLYPARSQLLKLVPDAKVMSSLAFNDTSWNGESSKWTSASKNRGDKGESPEGARVLKSVWSAQLLDLSSYAEAESEELSVYLYEAENVDIISAPPADGVVQAGGVLKSPQFSVGDSTRSEFRITGESAFAIFEFRTPDDEGANVVGKKLYVKVELALASSTFKKVDVLSGLIAGDSPGDGSEATPYVFGVPKDREVKLSALTENNVGVLAFAVKEASSADFTTLTGSSLNVNRGVLTRGDLAAGSWILRVSDPGTIEYEPQDLYFQLTFPLGSSSLELANVYEGDRDGSEGSPVEVTVLSSGITLSSLTTPASTGKTLSYEVVAAGSGLAAGTLISNASLKIGDTVDQARIVGGSFVLKVSEPTDNYFEAAAFYFRLVFETPSLEPNIIYSDQTDKGASFAAPIDAGVVRDTSLTLTDLIAPYGGSETYSLEREGEDAIALSSNTPLRVGGEFGNSSGVSIAADIPWVIKVADAPSGEGAELYFKVTFAKNSSNFKKSDSYTTTAGDGASTSAHVSTVAGDASLTLADLTTGESAAGTLSYTVDGTAATVTSLKVGEPLVAGGAALSPGEKTIIVTDSGDNFTVGGIIYFKVTFVLNSPNFRKSDSYTTTAGDGTSTSAYVSTVAADASLTLADLTTGASAAGTLSYTVDGAAATVTSLKVGEPLVADGAALSPGEKTIIVTDSGDNFTAGGVIYFKVTFVLNSSNFKKSDSYTTTAGDGTSASAYVSTVAADASLTLADLTTGKSAAGTLSYTVDGAATTAMSLKVGESLVAGGAALTAGEKTIIVSDSGDDFTAASVIYFKVTFTVNSSNFKKSDSYTTTAGDGTSASAYVSTVAADASLTLADLTTGKSAAGTLSYTVDGATATVASLKVGEPLVAGGAALTAGEKTIIVSDSGDDFTAADVIYFKVTFTAISSNFKKSDSYTTTAGDGTSASAYVSTVAADASLTLADLTTGASAAGTLSYTVDGAAATVTSLKVGEPLVAGGSTLTTGEKTIIVTDSGDNFTAGGVIYFKVTFTVNSSNFKKSDSYTTTAGDGTISAAYVSAVAAGASLTLADLTTGASAAGTLSYTVDGAAATVTSLKVGEPLVAGGSALTAGEKTIIVTDSGDNFAAGGVIYFKVTFTVNSSNFKKSDSYTTTAGDGTISAAYVSTVAAGASLTLADLTTGASAAGTLSYTVDGAAATVTSLKVGEPLVAGGSALTAGEKTIIVTDSGDNFAAGGVIYFKVTFTVNSSNFKKSDSYTTTAGDGTISAAYVSTVAAGASLTLADLTTGASAAGTLSYTVDGAAATVTSLKVGEPLVAGGSALTAGEKTIIVTDSGDNFAAGGAIYFKVTFTVNSSNFKKSDSYTTTAGDGTISAAYVSAVAAGASLTLADLTTGASAAGTLSYTVDGAAATVTSLKVGEPLVAGGSALTAGEKTIIVTDSGDNFAAGGVIYFKVTFTVNSSNFKKSDSYTTTAGDGTSASAYVSTVAAGASLTLADLTTGASAAGTLSYTVDGAAATVTSLKVGEPLVAGGSALTAGEKTIIVTDSGDNFAAGGVIYFKVTFTVNSSNFKKSDSYTTTAGDGTSASAYVSTVAAGASLTLADLTTGASAAGTLSYTVDGAAATVTSLKVGEPLVAGGSVLTAGEKTIIVTDSGDNFAAGGVIYFKVTFTVNSSNFKKSDSYTTTAGDGTSASAYVSTVAADASLTLADLTTGASAAGTLSYTVDGATATVASLKVGEPLVAGGSALTTGEKTIIVTDSGDNFTAAGVIYFKVTFTVNSSNFKKSDSYATTAGDGTSASAYVSTVAADASLTLADLTTGASAAGTLSYTVDGAAATVTSLKVGEPLVAGGAALTAGEKTIIVSDSGDDFTAAGVIYFKVTFTVNSSNFKKSDSYATTAGDGTISAAYVSTVAADASLTLADLTTGASAAGTLSYTVDGAAATVTSLKVGEPLVAGGAALTAGEKTIIVSDSGDDFTAAGVIYFKVTFTVNSSNFKKSDSYATTAGEGTSASAYVSTVAAGASLTLADLTTGASAAGTLSYTVDGATATVASLKVGEPLIAGGAALTAGEKTIIVSDSGDDFTAAGVIYFKVTFTVNSSNFKKSDSYTTTAGDGTFSSPYESTVAADASLALASLTADKSSGGTLSYTVDGITATVASLRVGEPLVAGGAALTAGEKTIIVTDSGDNFTAGGVIYFKVTFTEN